MLAFLNANKTKITGALLTTLAFVQTNSALGTLLSPTTYAWTMFFVGLFVTFLGFLNTPTPPSGPVSGQGGFARPLMLAFLLAVSVPLTLILSGCTVNPVKEAETFEQKSYALYGVYVIAQGKAAALFQDPAVPEKTKLILKLANDRSYPVATTLVDAAEEVGEIRTVLNRCSEDPIPDPTCVPTNEQRLANAINNLSAIYFKAQPVLLGLVSTVKGAK
jgi:hypothetical protein